MVIEQEQNVKEDARAYAKQDAKQNYKAEAKEKEKAIPKPPPVGPTEKLRVVCAWIGDDPCGDGDLPAWSSVTCSVQSDYRAVSQLGRESLGECVEALRCFMSLFCSFKEDLESRAECNIGEEGEWNGVVYRHTDTSVAVFCEQGSVSSMGHRVKREEAKITQSLEQKLYSET
nr:probable leucine-rich repeat receptor-like protein kinase At1g35710 [Tanacetum cinerariifolium]